MPPWTDRVYGVPPERVVGSSIKTRFMLRRDIPILLRFPQVHSSTVRASIRSRHSAIRTETLQWTTKTLLRLLSRNRPSHGR